jgi:hypothetical protein
MGSAILLTITGVIRIFVLAGTCAGWKRWHPPDCRLSCIPSSRRSIPSAGCTQPFHVSGQRHYSTGCHSAWESLAFQPLYQPSMLQTVVDWAYASPSVGSSDPRLDRLTHTTRKAAHAQRVLAVSLPVALMSSNPARARTSSAPPSVAGETRILLPSLTRSH